MSEMSKDVAANRAMQTIIDLCFIDSEFLEALFVNMDQALKDRRITLDEPDAKYLREYLKTRTSVDRAVVKFLFKCNKLNEIGDDAVNRGPKPPPPWGQEGDGGQSGQDTQ